MTKYICNSRRKTAKMLLVLILLGACMSIVNRIKKGHLHENIMATLGLSSPVLTGSHRITYEQMRASFALRTARHGIAGKIVRLSKEATIEDFFNILEAPRGVCRRLVRIGGALKCQGGDLRGMDGHKYVCLDEELELTPREKNGTPCLDFSFGISSEVTFEEGILDLGCQVHMFDVLDPLIDLSNERRAFFHLAGLSDAKKWIYYPNINVTSQLDSLSGHMRVLGLDKSVLHVLKVDIEGEEWRALRQLSQDGIIDHVAMIATEIHLISLTTIPRSRWGGQLQDYLDVIRQLEKRGFKMAASWVNCNDKHFLTDEMGKRYEIGIELLLVNTNWYDEAFKISLKHRGITGFKS